MSQRVERIPAKCHWCPNEASAYQDWDGEWVSVCLPCHLKDCINTQAHSTEAKRSRVTSTRDGGKG